MLDVTAPADEVGITTLAAAARAATRGLGGDGDAAGMLVRLVAEDARRRLSGGEEAAEIQMHVAEEGTELSITLRDRGAPIAGPPSSVLALLDLGVASRIEGQHDAHGNRTEVRLALPEHHAVVEHGEVEVLTEEAALSDEHHLLRPLTAVDADGLTQGIYRTYGWTYPNPAFYYPERIAAELAAETRIGEVAVSDSGDVVAHWGAVWIGPSIVETGGTFTDPRFRRRGLAQQVGDRLLARLHELGVEGRLREPVLTHTATQHIAAQEGATFVGIRLHDHLPFQQVGITDGLTHSRSSLSVAYSALRPLAPATVWVPEDYRPFLEHILRGTDWNRSLGEGTPEARWPDRSHSSSTYDTDERLGDITVDSIGDDLVDVVDATVEQMRHSGAAVVRVHLPANDPALAVVGAGLPDLGLGFSVYVPGLLPTGDAITVEWLEDPEIDVSEFHFVNEDIETLARMVIEQAGEVGGRASRQRRRAARRAQSRLMAQGPSAAPPEPL